MTKQKLAKWSFALSLVLAAMCIGALFLVGLALCSQSVPDYLGVTPLSPGQAGAIVFIAWACTAALFVAAVIAFAVAQRRAGGSRPIFRLPRTRSLLAQLLLALTLLTVLMFIDSGPASQTEQAEAPTKLAPSADLGTPTEPLPKQKSETTSGAKPVIRPKPVPSSPWPVYAVVVAALVLAGAAILLALGQKSKPVAAEPEDMLEPAEDQAVTTAWPDEEALGLIAQEPDPRVAVIMSYRLFLSLLRQAEAPIATHHTPEECGTVAVSYLKLPRRAVFRLVSLYSRARFSEHHVFESHKSAALAELRQITAIVRSRQAEMVSPEEVPQTVPSGSGRA